jgi:hypothetical protein
MPWYLNMRHRCYYKVSCCSQADDCPIPPKPETLEHCLTLFLCVPTLCMFTSFILHHIAILTKSDSLWVLRLASLVCVTTCQWCQTVKQHLKYLLIIIRYDLALYSHYFPLVLHAPVCQNYNSAIYITPSWVEGLAIPSVSFLLQGFPSTVYYAILRCNCLGVSYIDSRIIIQLPHISILPHCPFINIHVVWQKI